SGHVRPDPPRARLDRPRDARGHGRGGGGTRPVAPGHSPLEGDHGRQAEQVEGVRVPGRARRGRRRRAPRGQGQGGGRPARAARGAEASPPEPVDPPEEAGRTGGGRRGVDPDEEREEAADPEGEKSSPEELDESLEELVDRDSSNRHYDDGHDDDDGGDGAMKFAAPEVDEEVDFGDGGGDGFGDDDDAEPPEEDGGDDVSARASHRSRASSKSGGSDDVDPDDDGFGARSDDDEEEPEPEPPKKKAKKTMSKKSDSSTTTPTSVLRNTKKGGKKKKKDARKNKVNFSTPNGVSQGIPAGNRDFEVVPVSDYRDDWDDDAATPGGSRLRRSRRARFKPLDFWKNEKLVYKPQREPGLLGEAMGDMPVVAGVMHALPTPYRERKAPPEKKKKEAAAKGGKAGRGGRKRSGGDDDSDDDEPSREPFDDKSLRKKYKIRTGESGHVWSETLENTLPAKVVSRLDGRSFSKLPLCSDRKKRESKVVGFASQAFHVQTDDDDLFPGYIAGNVVMPPRGIKDAEGVGLCSQVFNVGDCQPNSVEFALADPNGQDGEFDPRTAQRYLLSKGDMFQIPPGNVYRIENHSKTDRATLFWTIVKCTGKAEGSDEDDEDDGSRSGETSS
ncbi:hypothetical protein THAOC_01743, partial [Thalassiosira oceanica]